MVQINVHLPAMILNVLFPFNSYHSGWEETVVGSETGGLPGVSEVLSGRGQEVGQVSVLGSANEEDR